MKAVWVHKEADEVQRLSQSGFSRTFRTVLFVFVGWSRRR